MNLYIWKNFSVMDMDRVLELAFFTLPAVAVALVAYYFFETTLKNETRKRQFMLARNSQKTTLPLRLQAYERMALFLERIDPAKLLIRIAPHSEDKSEYANLVVAQIEQEFEHNLAQQIYVSDQCWGIITTAKNATVQQLRKAQATVETPTANALRESILTAAFDSPSPSTAALAFIRAEVRDML